MVSRTENDAPHCYVLIAGAWEGGWIWGRVAAGLRERGHYVSTPTLTGLGERRHLGHGVDLETHVEDVVAHIEMEGLSDVTLVGASYGGMVITGVLARITEKVRAMIYLDAFVPEDGKAMIDYLAPAGQAVWNACRDADKPLPPLPLEKLGLTDPADIDFVVPRLVAQSWQTFYQPVKALTPRPRIPTAYIRCVRNPAAHFEATLQAMKADPEVRTDVIDAGHTCMLTAPAETVRLLEKYGA